MWPFKQLLLRSGGGGGDKYALPCRHLTHFGEIQSLRQALQLTNLLTGWVLGWWWWCSAGGALLMWLCTRTCRSRASCAQAQRLLLDMSASRLLLNMPPMHAVMSSLSTPRAGCGGGAAARPRIKSSSRFCAAQRSCCSRRIRARDQLRLRPALREALYGRAFFCKQAV
jgi:hypothetical protein